MQFQIMQISYDFLFYTWNCGTTIFTCFINSAQLIIWHKMWIKYRLQFLLGPCLCNTYLRCSEWSHLKIPLLQSKFHTMHPLPPPRVIGWPVLVELVDSWIIQFISLSLQPSVSGISLSLSHWIFWARFIMDSRFSVLILGTFLRQCSTGICLDNRLSYENIHSSVKV